MQITHYKVVYFKKLSNSKKNKKWDNHWTYLDNFQMYCCCILQKCTFLTRDNCPLCTHCKHVDFSIFMWCRLVLANCKTCLNNTRNATTIEHILTSRFFNIYAVSPFFGELQNLFQQHKKWHNHWTYLDNFQIYCCCILQKCTFLTRDNCPLCTHCKHIDFSIFAWCHLFCPITKLVWRTQEMRQPLNISWQLRKILLVYSTKMYISHKTHLPIVYAANMLLFQYLRGVILVFGLWGISLIWISWRWGSKNFSKKRSSHSLHLTISVLYLEIWALHSFSVFNLYLQPSTLHIRRYLFLVQRWEHFRALSKAVTLAEGVSVIIFFVERQDGHIADLPSPVQYCWWFFDVDCFANGPKPHFLHGSPLGPDFCGLNLDGPPAKDSKIFCQWYMNNKSRMHSQIQSSPDIIYTLCTFISVNYNGEQQNYFFIIKHTFAPHRNSDCRSSSITTLNSLFWSLTHRCWKEDKYISLMESENKISYLIQQGFVNLYFSDTCKLWQEICYLLHYHPAIPGALQYPLILFNYHVHFPFLRSHPQMLKRRQIYFTDGVWE